MYLLSCLLSMLKCLKNANYLITLLREPVLSLLKEIHHINHTSKTEHIYSEIKNIKAKPVPMATACFKVLMTSSFLLLPVSNNSGMTENPT